MMWPRLSTYLAKITFWRPGPGLMVTTGGRPPTVLTPTTSPVSSVTRQAWPAGSAVAPVEPAADDRPGEAPAAAGAAVAAAARSPVATLPASTTASAMGMATDRNFLINNSIQ